MNQQMKALKSANYVRLNRARLKREINTGEKPISEVFAEEIPDWLERMRIGELVLAQHGIGSWRAKEMLRQVPVHFEQQIAWVTTRQRNVISEMTDDFAERLSPNWKPRVAA